MKCFLFLLLIFLPVSLVLGQKPSFFENGNGQYSSGWAFGGGTTKPREPHADPNNPPIDYSLNRTFSIFVENRFKDVDGESIQSLQVWLYQEVPSGFDEDGNQVNKRIYDWVTISTPNIIEYEHDDRNGLGLYTVQRATSLVFENILFVPPGKPPFGAIIGDKCYFRSVLQNPKTRECLDATPPVQVELESGWSWGDPAVFKVTQYTGTLPDGGPRG